MSDGVIITDVILDVVVSTTLTVGGAERTLLEITVIPTEAVGSVKPIVRTGDTVSTMMLKTPDEPVLDKALVARASMVLLP